jgi:hypothetical protein
MAKFNIKTLNAEIAKHGVELVKGEGYFYFASLDDRCIAQAKDLESIYVCHFNQMTPAQWRSTVAASILDATTEGF